MNRGLSPVAFLLIIALILGGAYIYKTASAVCDVPIEYRVGAIDPKFGLTEAEARAALAEAEAIWEDATGLNLFTYDAGKGMPVNFVFDERQAETNAELTLREQLEERQHVSEEIRAKYDELSVKYDELKVAYDAKVASYEERLDAHNKEVSHWNSEGGAPEDVYEELQDKQRDFASEQRAINKLANDLNELADKLNNLGERGNVLVSAYNSVVGVYNNRFGEEHEFTQGDYRGDVINVYQFGTHEELLKVLAHELGHALSLGHVEGEDSFMYELMGAQDLESGLTEEDMAEFGRICNRESFVPSSWW